MPTRKPRRKKRVSADAQNGQQRRWQLIISIIGAAAVLLGIFGSIISFFVQIGTLSAASTTQADHIASLEKRLANANQQIGTLNIQATKQQSALVEIEVQFCATSHVMNLMHAFDIRTEALLWDKTFGATFPTAPVYLPVLCKQEP